MTARDWLIQNGYEEVASLIDEVVAELKAKGSKERRGWRETLSGGSDGKPRIVAGREFPVLYAAQKRQGKPVTPNAIRKSKREKPPPVQSTARWDR
jgi:hypothetical protein